MNYSYKTDIIENYITQNFTVFVNYEMDNYGIRQMGKEKVNER